jgi:hypothetical protein
MLNLSANYHVIESSLDVALAMFNNDVRDEIDSADIEAFTTALNNLAKALSRCSIARSPLRAHHGRLVGETGPYGSIIHQLTTLQDAVGEALTGPTPIDLASVNAAASCAHYIADTIELMVAAQLVTEAATHDDVLFVPRYGWVTPNASPRA